MTEYEALDLVDGVLGSMWAVAQFGFGLLSAYCLLAYYIGAKLSFFQVTFVNISFFMMNVVANMSIFNCDLNRSMQHRHLIYQLAFQNPRSCGGARLTVEQRHLV